MDAIARFSPSFLLSYAAAGIDSDAPAIKAASVTVLLMAGNAGQQSKAKRVLKMMVYHSDAEYRYSVTGALASVQMEGQSDYVLYLINDVDRQVVLKAIEASSLQPDDKIIDALMTKLEDRTFTYAAGNALVAIGSRAIPALTTNSQAKTQTKCPRF